MVEQRMDAYRSGEQRIDPVRHRASFFASLFAQMWGRARAKRENMRFRTSTKCWIAASIFGAFAFASWNFYMIHDSLVGRVEHILSWDGAMLAWLGVAFTVFFTIAGFHKRFEKSD